MPPEDSQRPLDPTPIVGAPTDIASLTHAGPKAPHERTAAEETGSADWHAIAASAAFRELLRSKRRFIVPAMVISILYYFALPVLVGWCPELMKKKIGDGANLAYLFALSQFFMAWIVAGIYVAKAGAWDKAAARLRAESGRNANAP
ncbi:MAG: DUF485 domain-containing protein [Chthoniobacterales bacterium]